MSSRKVINFDLDTHALKNHYGSNYQNAYYDLRKGFERNGYTHQQGTCYISKKAVSYANVVAMCISFNQTYPWLKYCVHDIMVSNLPKKYDLTSYFKGKANNTVQQSKEDSIEPPEDDECITHYRGR